MFDLFKEVRGKKYKYQGEIPYDMKHESVSLFSRHGFKIHTERSGDNVRLWTRKGKLR